MPQIQLQRLFDQVLQQIHGRDGDGRHDAERLESNLRWLAGQCLIELATDTKAWLSTVGLAVSPTLLPASVVLDEGWQSLDLANDIGEAKLHVIPQPQRYLALKTLLVSGQQAWVAGDHPVDIAEYLTPVYETLPDGWRLAGWDSAQAKYVPVPNGTSVRMEYFTYPDILDESVVTFTGHALVEPALLHLMLHHLQSRDPMIEFSRDVMSPGQFNHAAWHRTKYQEFATKITLWAQNAYEASSSTIKPYYL